MSKLCECGYNKPIEAFGQKLTVRQWSQKFGVHSDCIRGRLRLGWPAEKAIQPARAE